MSALRKELGFFQGLALYLAAVLGTGILVIPSLAWKEAGSASLIAWLVLSLVGFALAWTFASVGARKPDAGGVQSMIAQAMGKTTGDLCGWLVLFSVPPGAVAASHIFADHFIATIGLPVFYAPWIAWGGLLLIAAVNFFGIKISANAQLLLSGLLVLLLTVIVLFSLPHLDRDHFQPFLPMGTAGIGKAAVLIFWAFLGWEAIAHLAEEFKEPRDIFRSAWVAALIVGVLYLVVSVVLIGTGALTAKSASGAPLTVLATGLFGRAGGIITGALASIICIGTMNAYMAGLSRLSYAMARNKSLPSWIGKLSTKTGTPRRAIFFLTTLYSFALWIQAHYDLPMKNFFLIPNVAFLTLYTLGCLSAARILRGEPIGIFISLFAAAACIAIIPFAADILIYPLIVIGCALVYLKLISRFSPS